MFPALKKIGLLREGEPIYTHYDKPVLLSMIILFSIVILHTKLS